MNNSRIVAHLSSLRRHHLRRSQEGPAEDRLRTLSPLGGHRRLEKKGGSALAETEA
jgi:hypothetical protein